MATLILSACVQAPAKAPVDRSCAQWFETVDKRVREAGMLDAGAYRVPGFTYLRSNRLLASLATDALEPDARRAWLMRMRALDLHDRWIELRNLYPDVIEADRIWTRLAVCGKRMMRADMARTERMQTLSDAVAVPHAYRRSARLLGAYPLAVPFLKWGIADWRAQRAEVFSLAQKALPVAGQLQRYALSQPTQPNAEKAHAWLAAARQTNPLGLPTLPSEQFAKLAAAHAPVWEVDTVGAYDRIGAPGRDATGLFVDTAARRVYVQPAYTRFDGNILLQIVYVAWFDRRPAEGWFDPLAGPLDGIMWRVTLDTDGQVLMYDSAHACGCYHQFFPSDRVRRRSDSGYWQEAVMVPAAAPKLGPPLLRIASGTHYLQAVTHRPSQDLDAIEYRLVAYDALRERRPERLFDPTGLVPGSERPERWFLWPSGVRSAGAMRQWGHHATAFVGKRHFDDPFLIERYFERLR